MQNKKLREEFEEEIRLILLPCELVPDLERQVAHCILSFIENKIEKTEKAFGGCMTCYGKGYSTQMEWHSGIGDFIGDPDVEKAVDYFKPCICDRGKQFEKIIQENK